LLPIKSEKSPRLNVLGFLNRKNDLETYLFECNINSDIVIACIDNFCDKQTEATVLVIDNASIHTSNKIINKQSCMVRKKLNYFIFT
jgi:hypothetical protein